MEAAFASETLVPINQTSLHHMPGNHYLDLTVSEKHLVENCCELGHEPDVLGAEFINQLSDYQWVRNFAA
jgi:hypothetical protein